MIKTTKQQVTHNHISTPKIDILQFNFTDNVTLEYPNNCPAITETLFLCWGVAQLHFIWASYYLGPSLVFNFFLIVTKSGQ